MASNTYVALATETLTSNASSITFNNIPQGYADLVIVANVSNANANTGLYARFNNDVQGNYSHTSMYGVGSGSGSSYKEYSTTAGLVGSYSESLSTCIINIQNYSNGSAKKITIGRSNTSYMVQATAALWNNIVNPITSVTLLGFSNPFLSGSTFNLYGIASASVGAKAIGGDLVTSDDNYWYHVFRGSGTLTPIQTINAEVLIIAGGGGGGSYAGGGGGAGGYRTSTLSLSTSPLTVTVGAGGNGGAYTQGSQGSSSTFSSITSAGGGYGGGGSFAGQGGSGGSGGGSAAVNNGTNVGGSATPSGQGFAGGGASFSGVSAAPGGGGAGAAAANVTGTTGSAGGIGLNTLSSWATVTGTGVSGYYAGGGSGGFDSASQTGASGGLGGGGAGALTTPTAGTANTGGGGGGVWNPSYTAGKGGSGIVIVRYAK